MGALRAIVVAILVRSYAMGEQGTGFHVMSVGNSQMKYEAKGSDGVTYGCFGYLDPNNQKQQTYYVVDEMAYRIIYPNLPTKIFTAKRTDSLNNLDGSVQGKNYDERVVEWNDLYMPEACFRLNEFLDHALGIQVPTQKVATPHQPDISHVQVQPLPPVRNPHLPQPTQHIAQPVQPIATAPPLQTTPHIIRSVPLTTSSPPLQTTQHNVPTTPGSQVDEAISTDRWDIDDYDV